VVRAGSAAFPTVWAFLAMALPYWQSRLHKPSGKRCKAVRGLDHLFYLKRSKRCELRGYQLFVG